MSICAELLHGGQAESSPVGGFKVQAVVTKSGQVC